MDLIPADELKPKATFNFAPMIDFLFLMLSLFATLAISRASLYDTDLNLVQLKPEEGKGLYQSQSEIHNINVSISEKGNYKWITEFQSYPMESLEAVQKELVRQYELGLFPKDKSKTEVLLHIDKSAPWEPIAKLIFSIREAGFQVFPIYEPKEEKL